MGTFWLRKFQTGYVLTSSHIGLSVVLFKKVGEPEILMLISTIRPNIRFDILAKKVQVIS